MTFHDKLTDDYISDTQAAPRLDTSVGGTNDILASAGSESGGVTVIKYVRSLDTGDVNDKVISNTGIHVTNMSLMTGDMSCILAYNPTSDDRTIYHGQSNRVQLTINFFTGGTSRDPYSSPSNLDNR